MSKERELVTTGNVLFAKTMERPATVTPSAGTLTTKMVLGNFATTKSAWTVRKTLIAEKGETAR